MLSVFAVAVLSALASVQAAPAAPLNKRSPVCVADYLEFTLAGYTIGTPEKMQTYLRLKNGQLFDNNGYQVISVLGNLELVNGYLPYPVGVDAGSFEVCTGEAGDELYFVPAPNAVETPTTLKYCSGIAPDNYVSVLLPDAPALGYACQVGGVITELYTGIITVPGLLEDIVPFPLLLNPIDATFSQIYTHQTHAKRDFIDGLAMNFVPTSTTTTRVGEVALPKIALATMFRNSRKYLFEWIEFYRLQGVEHFLLYDNESEDSPLELLQPYIESGIVELVSWPPKDISSVTAPSATASDAKTNAQNVFLNKALKACVSGEWQTHKQGPCQFAASVDMLRRAEGKYDWLGFFDVDEFVYPAKQAGVSSLPALFGSIEPFASADYIGIAGSNFGTSGHVQFPQAAAGDSLPPLMTANYVLRRSINVAEQSPFQEGIERFLEQSSVSGSLPQTFAVPATFAQKAFVRPSKAAYSIVHGWIMAPDAEDVKRVDVSLESPMLKMNHYAYLSQEDAAEKARINGNPLAAYNDKQDAYYSQELDLAVDYLLAALRRKMQASKQALGLKV